MKGERRHELQQNSLARFLENLPMMLRIYADRILLVVVLVLLVIVLINWRVKAAAQKSAMVANDLASARSAVKELERLRMVGTGDQIAAFRGQQIDQVNAAIESIAANATSSDATVQAHALLTRGDLYWTLANLPEIPGAATQPSLKLPKSYSEYLGEAAVAYGQVLATYPNDREATLSAQFGLAAISENRGNWDDAAKRYTQIKESSADKMYRDIAEARLKLLPEIKEPVLIGSLTTKPIEVNPLVMAPVTQPATQATTNPFIPLTQPSN